MMERNKVNYPSSALRTPSFAGGEGTGFFSTSGFTLLEVLIALFVFTFIAIITATTLHSVFTTQSVTEQNAERFNKLEFAWMILSRDLQQIVDRPITNSQGQTEAALVGTAESIAFTHMGIANPDGMLLRSSLQRVRYSADNMTLTRTTWPALDQSAKTESKKRVLLRDATEIHFEYLDQNNHFQNTWPSQERNGAALPRAIRISITLKNLGKMSQLYVIPH